MFGDETCRGASSSLNHYCAVKLVNSTSLFIYFSIMAEIDKDDVSQLLAKATIMCKMCVEGLFTPKS